MPRCANDGRARRARRARAAVASLGVALSTSCTLQAGRPWGEADLSLQATLALPDDRRDGGGAWVTSSDWAIELQALTISLGALRLVVQSDGDGSSTAFDPANPPAGYSLCHGGHCHSDDGRLVAYDDIAAELAGGAVAGGFTLAREVDEADGVDLAAGARDVGLGPCVPDCSLPPGALSRVEVSMSGLRLQATVRDRRTGGNARLVGDHDVGFDVDLDAVVAAAVEGSVGRHDPIGVRANALLAVTPRLFDGVDFAAVVGGDDASLASVAGQVSSSTLAVDVERFIPDAPAWSLSPEEDTP